MSPLAAFLYLLMRDELPAGTVAKIVSEVSNTNMVPSNGYLARYAQELATQINAGEN